MTDSDPKVLLDFLERVGPEVSGHHWPEPSHEAAKNLARFARGECDEPERETLCRLLHERPSWLRWVANQVRAERAKNGAVSQRN